MDSNNFCVSESSSKSVSVEVPGSGRVFGVSSTGESTEFSIGGIFMGSWVVGGSAGGVVSMCFGGRTAWGVSVMVGLRGDWRSSERCSVGGCFVAGGEIGDSTLWL